MVRDLEEKTELISGEENTVKRTLEDFLCIKEKLDNCLDSTGPSVIIAAEQVRSLFVDLRNRGIRIRFITEITREN